MGRRWGGVFCEAKKHSYVDVMEYGSADRSNQYKVCSHCLGACLLIHINSARYMTLEEIRDSKVIVCHIGFVSGCREKKAT